MQILRFLLVSAMLALPTQSFGQIATESTTGAENLCDILPELRANIDFDNSNKVREFQIIMQICSFLSSMRQEEGTVDVGRFEEIRKAAEKIGKPLEDFGVTAEEVAAFERQVALQEFLQFFSDGMYSPKNISQNLGYLERNAHNAYSTAAKGIISDFLYGSYGGLPDFLKQFQNVSLLLDEVSKYKDAVVLCESNEPLPDTFWNLLKKVRKSVLKGRFGDARAAFGEARGMVRLYKEMNALCLRP